MSYLSMKRNISRANCTRTMGCGRNKPPNMIINKKNNSHQHMTGLIILMKIAFFIIILSLVWYQGRVTIPSLCVHSTACSHYHHLGIICLNVFAHVPPPSRRHDGGSKNKQEWPLHERFRTVCSDLSASDLSTSIYMYSCLEPVPFLAKIR